MGRGGRRRNYTQDKSVASPNEGRGGMGEVHYGGLLDSLCEGWFCGSGIHDDFDLKSTLFTNKPQDERTVSADGDPGQRNRDRKGQKKSPNASAGRDGVPSIASNYQ